MKSCYSIFILSLLLTGCASAPTPGLVDFTLQASENQNKNINGKASPTAFRLYELERATAFKTATFPDLYYKPEKTLGPDLTAIEKFNIRPREKKQFKISMKPASSFLGIVAAYRQIDQTRWRYVLPVTAGVTQDFELEMTDKGIIRIIRIKSKRHNLSDYSRSRGAI